MTMELKRRSFMGGILAAFATTPEKVLKASGVEEALVGTSIGDGENAPTSLVELYPTSLPEGGSNHWWIIERTRLMALKALNPKWFEEKRRAAAHNVEVLDLDLACLRSMSPAAKIIVQRQRNYERDLSENLRRLDITAKEQAFKP